MGVCGSQISNKPTINSISKTNNNSPSKINQSQSLPSHKYCNAKENFNSKSPKRASSFTNNTKELNLSTKDLNDSRRILTTRHSSFKETAKRISLIHKSKFCPSSSATEELKLPVQVKYLIDESNDVPSKKYRIIAKIGEGSFGTVFYAKNLLNKAEVAIKKIVKSQDNTIDDLDITNEIEILKRIDHPNIIKVFEFYNTKGAYSIINEYCSKGELFNKYSKEKFSERQLSALFYQIFSGLNYLHSNGVIHRDLKLENILISDIEEDEENKEQYYIIKLIDFGCAKFIDKRNKEKSMVGTYYYMAPEVIKKKYNCKCDIWSAGVILYMLITGTIPFEGEDNETLISAIVKGKYNSNPPSLLNCSNELRDLLSRLLEVKEDKRLSARECLEHNWFNKYNGKHLITKLSFSSMTKLMDNLIHFILKSKFQQIVLAYFCHNMLPSDETKNITKLFFILNKSNSGTISKDELLQGLYLFIGEDEANEIIDELFISIDGANNGFIEYEEFLRACVDKEAILQNDQMIQYAFKFFDKDNNDAITFDELKQMFKERCNTTKHIDDICTDIIDNNNDTNSNCNQNGVIDLSYFKKLISNPVIEME